VRNKLWNRLLLVVIIGLTALSFAIVWPSEPDRYLPDAIPWPEGQGMELSLPTIEGGSFGMETIERRAMSLGLDLRGGTRLVLEPEEGFVIEDLDNALDGARDVIERRVDEFGVAESEVNRLGDDRLAVQLPGIEAEEAINRIGRTALLQFCEPLTDATGNVGVTQLGNVRYKPQSCEPERDEAGEIIVDPPVEVEGDAPVDVQGSTEIEFVPWYPDDDQRGLTANPPANTIVWVPATADVDGRETALDGRVLRSNTRVQTDQVTGTEVYLFFEWREEGRDAAEAITDRLSARNYPLAVFLDGEPVRGDNDDIIAPHVQSSLRESGQITGLSRDEAQDLSKLLNTGAFPIPLRVVQQQDVDATLGEAAVRNSVIAGEIALLIIMAFMILYYRLPGVMASLALVCYTAFSLAIFKLWPVTLALAGVGAFILSVGMAVDANILIFERMKEELRLGRNLSVALEDGFNRAWSSIRDSNISTLITCVILYWFGSQFDEAAIKGFAITLAIGVLVSMFSAITVTRTFMYFIIGFRPIARRLWLFVPDPPPPAAPATGRRVPAMAGGSNGAARKGER
jgi:preprotein translocase subunit SecD